jgi:tetratricopeptide (TPR) repeat protein
LTGGAWVATYRAYKKAQAGKERLILGFLALLLGYFTILSIIVPLSYAMLVVWMVIAGFGIARLPLDHMYASKKIAYVLIPLALLVLGHTYMTTNKALAMNVYMQAQKELTEKGPTDQAEILLARAVTLSPFDGFYRTQVEYAIARERALLSSTELSEEEIRTKYLEKAQYAVDAGLAAVKANPNNYQNYVSLGRAYELAVPFDKTAGYDNAKKSYQEAIRLYPNNPYLYVMLARLEASAGTKEGVRVHLGEALSKKQNFADALYLMSQLEVSEERLEEALAYAVEAVKAAPNDPNVYIQAGLLFYAKKDYQNAVAALDRALALEPANANTAYFLALSLRDGGQVDIAKQIGEELLKRNPGNADLETFLASLEAKTGTATSTPKK